MDELTATDPTQAFIQRWQASSAAERSNFQSFAKELCQLLGLPEPEPSRDPAHDAYVFEHPVAFPEGTTGRIDLYKKGCFVMEAKQGSNQALADQLALFGGAGKSRRGTAVRNTADWALAMQRAKGQAERYARALPADHGHLPFLVVVDVGHAFEIYADFSKTGRAYTHFPDAQNFRLPLEALADDATKELLRAIWERPQSLDPTARTERVTKEVSTKLAAVAKALEATGHHPETVAGFLMRCMFSMFAEDVGLLPKRAFSTLLAELRDREVKAQQAALSGFWADMDRGTPFSGYAREAILRFNGGLFADRTALPLERHHLGLLIDAAKADWRDVEPAIFGTFLEQALEPRERQRLGAEFTPRRWVERLVLPAVVEPLRDRWDTVKTEVVTRDLAGDHQGAVASVKAFHRELCTLRVLDPACGTGNFLYVTMEHLKRLEGEVLDTLRTDLGEPQEALALRGSTVDPHQFLGLEINPRAAQIADVVLWIGYLQWHFRTQGRVMPAQPVLKNFNNVECRDALLEHDGEDLVRDEAGKPVTRWDGRTTRIDLVTGREVPDETARVELTTFRKPRPAPWPEADYIVGNPPFVGAKYLRDRLGSGYAEALWQAYPDMPRSADFVMYWWKRAADRVRTGKAQRFGLITTNSLPQTFNRRVVAAALDGKPPLSLAFAIPDHPWYVDGSMAQVRIAMTVGVAGIEDGTLQRVVDPQRSASQGGDALAAPTATGRIHSDLTLSVDLDAALPLRANERLCSRGVQLMGGGFIVTPERARELGLGRVHGLEKHIRPYRNGKDLTQRARGVLVIDLYGLREDEVRTKFPDVYQYVLTNVKPDRDGNNRASYRTHWWVFGEPRSEFRPAIGDLRRFVVTLNTAKHRVFQFIDAEILPDDMLISIASDDAYVLGVLSSEIHVVWALAAGTRLGVGNDPRYIKSRCFDPFPFPDATAAQRAGIGALAEELDALRKRVLAEHGDLTLTGLYNVRQALQEGRALTAKERDVHDRGLVSVLADLHRRLDEAVAQAYGWPVDLAEADVLARVVALNRERRAEEERGLVRWLRPDYQAPAATTVVLGEQGKLDVTRTPTAAKAAKAPWPKDLAGRIGAVRTQLAKAPATPEAIASAFQRRPVDDVADILAALTALGHARPTPDGRFAA